MPRPDMVTVDHDATVTAGARRGDRARLQPAAGAQRRRRGRRRGRPRLHQGPDARRARRRRRSGRSPSSSAPSHVVPENKPVNRLMREMQAEKYHLAIVADEYGAHRRPDHARGLPRGAGRRDRRRARHRDAEVERLPDGDLLVDGGMPIYDLNDLLDVAPARRRLGHGRRLPVRHARARARCAASRSSTTAGGSPPPRSRAAASGGCGCRCSPPHLLRQKSRRARSEPIGKRRRAVSHRDCGCSGGSPCGATRCSPRSSSSSPCSASPVSIGAGNRPERFDAKTVFVQPAGGDGVRITEVVDQDFGSQRPPRLPADHPQRLRRADRHRGLVARCQRRRGRPDEGGSTTRSASATPTRRSTASTATCCRTRCPTPQLSTGQLALDIIGTDETLETGAVRRRRGRDAARRPDLQRRRIRAPSAAATLVADGDTLRATIAPLEPGEGITIGGTVVSTDAATRRCRSSRPSRNAGPTIGSPSA